MATLGARIITKGAKPAVKAVAPLVPYTAQMDTNLVTPHVQFQPIATIASFERPIGAPIMREGFITQTGFFDS